MRKGVKDLGFQKKLCNDGYYYFGIIDKYDNENLDHKLNNSLYMCNGKMNSKDFEMATKEFIKEFINERNKETTEIVTTLKCKRDEYFSNI